MRGGFHSQPADGSFLGQGGGIVLGEDQQSGDGEGHHEDQGGAEGCESANSGIQTGPWVLTRQVIGRRARSLSGTR